MSVDNSYQLSGVCLNIKVSRKYELFVFRFFGPMLLLISTTVLAFFLPVSATMPRVSIGFVSFLSLQVFTTRAYNMLPQMAHSLTFIDALMFSITEMLFLAVCETIVAIRLYATVSHYAANHLDVLCQIWFPVMMFSVILLELSMAMWVGEISKGAIVGVSQILIFSIMGAIALKVTFYIRHLPRHIICDLVKDISSGKIHWSNHKALHSRELSTIFKFMDKDMSGHISKDEFTQTFKNFGLESTEDEHRELNRVITEKCGDRIDFPTFELHFGEFFAGSHRRSMRSGSFKLHNASFNESETEGQSCSSRQHHD